MTQTPHPDQTPVDPQVDQSAPVDPTVDQPEAAVVDREAELQALVTERTSDLQRLQAEYVNYKKRVDRDRTLARQSGAESVVLDLLPVLDSIGLARDHGDLNGGFKLVSDEIDKVAQRHGLVGFGAVGEEFDPQRHEALMQQPLPEPVEVPTISQVMQTGYEMNGRVIRPARVAVAQPGA